ncbi:MAG: hypothetical protein H6722_20775 [Sandaracinus sp.]|nr:hypothetical protein [Sandaracinus sp.]
MTLGLRPLRRTRVTGRALGCDPGTNTCQPTCETNADCAGGFVCYAPEGATTPFCVNPTCDS